MIKTLGATARVLLILGGPALLASGCATRQIAVAPATTPPPPLAMRPTPPAGLPETLAVPARDADGRYRTINHALTPDQVVWHVRSALNVAVLACRGPQEAEIAADYNALLTRQKQMLATAYAGVQARFRETGSGDWQSAQDAHATRVYNFFALPPAKPAFCAAATRILQESRTVDPAAFALFADGALPRLEQPFTDIYRAYDGYRRELAAWEAQRPGTTATATAQAAVPTRPLPQALPRLDYVGLDTLIDWQPRGPERLATRR